MIVVFVYYDSSSVAATVAEITYIDLRERIWGWILEKQILYPEELLVISWNFVIISQ